METPAIPLVPIIILIFQGVTTLIVTLVGWWVKGISAQLREMNGNVRDLKAWKEVHQPQEERWHKENRENHQQIWNEMKVMREDK